MACNIICYLLQDKKETAALQWQCFKLILFNHFFIQVSIVSIIYNVEMLNFYYHNLILSVDLQL